MNTNPEAVRVLCFGDSNTFGVRSDAPDEGRWPADVRWTGRLQEALGADHDVIEEGLNGRTTDLDEPGRPGRNGLAYLVPCLESHLPVDVVVLMLGLNDLKTVFGRGPAEVAAAIGGLLDVIDRFKARAVLLSPVVPDPGKPLFADIMGGGFDATTLVERARGLAGALRDLAAERGVIFGEAGAVAGPGPDGGHLELESHTALAALVAGLVRRAS
ncbi:GDSL-type esterase/lipase family protein [Allokutzneria sp. A3M-2-11 16]|uniref:GDSL-type esterase/lipase family protein n=1 Tax=Allokutzneria sp. A3M-2-11 16 TaxID=2962043 RepID=UPI0020B8FEAC|nr:GDSL-type esterase/lipase family protein [Allokutzneria sp. A3M-2-11 16]MCP3803756.1 GDSL-type esterase/lipase family protein [Allokutzneria sp. A3M-2-11 16]